MALSEIIFLRTQRLTLRLAIVLLIGIGGVTVLMSRSLHLGGAPIDGVGAAALIVASMSWPVSSALTLKLRLPSSKVMSSRAQMLAGGMFGRSRQPWASFVIFVRGPSHAERGSRWSTLRTRFLKLETAQSRHAFARAFPRVFL